MFRKKASSATDVAQGAKLTFDGGAGSKYFSSDGTNLTLTGLGMNAPSFTSSTYVQINPLSTLAWSGLGIGLIAGSAAGGLLLNSFGGSGGALQPGVGGTAYRGITPGNNGTTVETTLDSFTLPASTLNANGRGVRITAWGTFAANANTKTVRLKFGATDLTSGAFTGTTNAGSWKVSALVFRTGAATQTAMADWGTTVGTISRQGLVTAPAETLSGTVLVALTGQSGTASNDITSAALLIEALN